MSLSAQDLVVELQRLAAAVASVSDRLQTLLDAKQQHAAAPSAQSYLSDAPPPIPAELQSTLRTHDSSSRLSTAIPTPSTAPTPVPAPVPLDSASQVHAAAAPQLYVADWTSHLSSVSTASQAIKRSSQRPSA